MANKKAVVFDTNFIIENKNRLSEVIKNLKTQFNVYITQVSIEERVAQKQREAKASFDEVDACAKKHHSIAKFSMLKTLEKECQNIENSTTNAYKKMVEDNVIPYNKEEVTFEIILDRAYKKTPPFPLNEKSDNGFKDTVLWLSIINYFKNNGEDEIVLISEDKAFGKNQDILVSEFKSETNKIIKIVPNSYYNDLFNHEEQNETTNEILTDVSPLRNKISEIIYDLCGYEMVDNWGNEFWERYFKMSTLSNPSYAKAVLDALPKVINANIFEQFVSAYDIFDFDDRIQGNASSIPIESVEAANNLHKDIKQKYPDYLEQFYLTVSNIFNSNYDSSEAGISDVTLPF